MESIDDILADLYPKWLEAKRELAKEYRRLRLYKQSALVEGCKMFEGKESLEEIVWKLCSPQGVEFCIKAKFPSLADLRRFKGFDVERFGIYIDAGDVSIKNPDGEFLLFAGDTRGKVVIDGRDCVRSCEVVLVRGARCEVYARGWGMVHLEVERGCECKKFCEGKNAIIL